MHKIHKNSRYEKWDEDMDMDNDHKVQLRHATTEVRQMYRWSVQLYSCSWQLWRGLPRTASSRRHNTWAQREMKHLRCRVSQCRVETRQGFGTVVIKNTWVASVSVINHLNKCGHSWYKNASCVLMCFVREVRKECSELVSCVLWLFLLHAWFK